MASLEVTPLLADPPIDDDSYRYEARSFPNREQKHSIYMAYISTTLISRFCEIAATLMLAMTYTDSLLPLAFYSFAVLAVSAWYDRIVAAMTHPFTSRLGLLAATIVQQRAAMAVFYMLVLHRAQSPAMGWVARAVNVAGLSAAMIWLKASLAVFQSAFRWEWLRIMTNNQQSLRMVFESRIHATSTASQLIFPIVAGIMASALTIPQCCHVVFFGAGLGLLVELSIVYKLYSSCYALHLPRAAYTAAQTERSLEQGAMIGVLTTPLTSAALAPLTVPEIMPFSSRPLTRIVKYIRRKPVPVAVTIGSVLTNISLVTMGPHVVWYLVPSVSPVVLGVMKMLQTLVTLRSVVSGWRSFAVSAVGIVTSVVLLALTKYDAANLGLWAHAFGFSIVLARAGVPGVTHKSHAFLSDYIADEDVLKLYKDGAALLQIECELLIHVLAVIWPYRAQFLWQMGFSSVLTLAGLAIIAVVIVRYSR